MAKRTAFQWSLDSTAAEIVRSHPELAGFFEGLGVDDCCMDLDLRTIAAHCGIDGTDLIARLRHALHSAE